MLKAYLSDYTITQCVAPLSRVLARHAVPVVWQVCTRSKVSRALWDQRQCGGDLGAALETNRKLYGKAEWRQHFTAGRSRRIPAGFDCQRAGPDVGRDRCGDGETRNRVQPHRGLAVLRSAQHQL